MSLLLLLKKPVGWDECSEPQCWENGKRITHDNRGLSLFSMRGVGIRKLIPTYGTLMCFVLILCVATPFAHAGQSSEIKKNLPLELNIENFISWLMPSRNDGSVRIVRARKWNANQYVIMACIVKSPVPADESESPKGECGNDFDIYIGVISASGQTYNFEFRTSIPIPINADDDYSHYDLMLDLAPYRVNETTTAIGFRQSSGTAYAGGGSGREQLWLFVPYREELQEILSLNVHSYEVLAEDWNADGSRNHVGDDYKTTLHTLKTKTNGFYDYNIKTVQTNFNGKEIKKSIINARYIWSKDKKQYVPKE